MSQSPHQEKGNVFVYVVYNRTASKKEKGKWDVFEEVYVKNSEKRSLMDTSTVVLDCANMTVVKDRSTHGYGFMDYLNYLASNHTEVAKIKNFIDRTLEVKKNLEESELPDEPVNVDTSTSEESGG